VLDGLIGVRGPVRGGGEEGEPFTAEGTSVVGVGQDLVGLRPRMSLECAPSRDDRVVGWCNHARILRRWPLRSRSWSLWSLVRPCIYRPRGRYPALTASGTMRTPEGHAHPKGER